MTFNEISSLGSPERKDKKKKIFSHEVEVSQRVALCLRCCNILFENMCMIVIRNEEGVLQVCNTWL